MIRNIKDMRVEKSQLASAKGNPNKTFKILYGSERRELFRKYAQEQHRFPKEDDDGIVTDFNDINTWIRPIPGFGENEYYNPSEFDAIIKKLQEADESAQESKELVTTQEETVKNEEEERARTNQLIEQNTEKNVKLKEGSGIKYLGIGGRFRIYAVTSREGAQQFATPSSMSNVTGWCITGGKGPKWKWGTSSYFSGEASRTINGTFYVFETTNIADNWCVYILKSSAGINHPHLAFTPNDTDHNYYGIPKRAIDEGVPYMKVPELAEYADQTPMLDEHENRRSRDDVNGIFRYRGTTLLQILDQNTRVLDVPAAYTETGNNSFSDLHYLERISFRSTLTRLGNESFSGCLKLKEVELNSSNLTLGINVWAYCSSLEKIDIHSVTSIPSRTFYNCSNLKVAELSSNLTGIGKEAFLNCSDLTIMEIPSTCTTIQSNAFFGCKNLTIRTTFTEKPGGWYRDIENHVKAIEYAEKPEEVEEETQTTEDSKTKLCDLGKDDVYNHIYKVEFNRTLPSNIFANSNPHYVRYVIAEDKEDAQYTINKMFDMVVFDKITKVSPQEASKLDGAFKEVDFEVKWIDFEETQTTEDSKKDIKILDINPKEGESKEDFISRFMSETKEEYPDEKQRVAVAYSYWNRNKKKINDSEVYSLWDLFHNNDCAGWIIKMDDSPNLCVFSNSNNLGFLEEDEDSMSDKLVLEEKHEIAPNLYIYIGHSDEPDVFNTKTFESDELATVEEAVEDIKASWPQVKEAVEDSKKKIADDYYNSGIPKNAWEIFVNLYSTGDYQKNIPDNEKTKYCILPKQKAYWKTNQEDFYKSDISKSSMMLYSYPQDTLEDVERVAQDIINKCGAKLVSESEYLALKNEDEVSRASEIFANFEARKMNDSSEIVIDTSEEKIEDAEITPEEQEVKEIVVNFSIQALAKEAKDDLKTASDEQQLETKYNNWLSKSDELLNEGKITVNQQEEFEDELWDYYNELLD